MTAVLAPDEGSLRCPLRPGWRARYAYDPATNAGTPLPNTKYPLYQAGAACGLTVIGGAAGGWPGMAEAK